jgi:predicted methyltransferase
MDAVDLAFCANTLHEVDEASFEPFVRSLFEGVKPGGRLAVIEWLPEDTGVGPPVEDRLAPEKIRALAEGAGFRFEATHGFLAKHSFLVFRRPPKVEATGTR